jgi:ATP-binding cassette, subfamily B, bacterial PglK
MITTLIKFFQILNSKLRKRAILLLILSLFIIPLELLSIAIIIPIFSIIFQPTAQTNLFISLDFLNQILSHEYKIEIILIILIMIFLVKNIFLAFFIKLKVRYVFLIQEYVSHHIFFKYLNSDYNFQLKNDSSTIARNIITEINIFTRSFFLSALDLIMENIVLITICIFLLIYDFKTTILIISILGLSTYVIQKNKKKRINEFALRKQVANKYVLQLISAVFNGIKEIKVNFLETKILNKFDKLNSTRLLNDASISFHAAMPRLLFEFISIFAIVMIILLKNDEAFNIGEAIAVYTFAIFRVMPSFIKIAIILQNLTVSKPSIKIIEDHFIKNKNEIKIAMRKNEEMTYKINNNHIQKFNHVKFMIDKFKYDKEIILKNFVLDIEENDKICISGKTGVGKSTLINIVTGIVDCKNLKIIINNKKVDDNLLFQKSSFSYMPQSSTIFQATIEENITFFDDNIDEEKYRRAVALSKCDFIEKFREKNQTIVAEDGANMSGGQLQRIFIARAIYSDKKILIFDESTNQLDDSIENQIVNDILNLPKMVIFVTHKENIKKKFNKVIELNRD